jgi:putative methyltransferase (TIGR04325 family)
MKDKFKQFVPPIFVKLTKSRSKYGWFGNYKTWEEASRKCSGYDDVGILEKVKNAVLKVKMGEAAYERDSVLFDKTEYSWPLLSSLMWVAAVNKGKLNVLDFGGSLGSSYFQNKKFLDALDTVHWNVVEQKNFVECGEKFFQDEKLRFFNSSSDALEQLGSADILVIACTLPYLQEPYAVLRQLMNLQIPYIILDNTYFNYTEEDRISIQQVSPQIYKASYPCWFLNYHNVIKIIREKYSIVSEHENNSHIYLDGVKIQYRGFLAKINKDRNEHY